MQSLLRRRVKWTVSTDYGTAYFTWQQTQTFSNLSLESSGM